MVAMTPIALRTMDHDSRSDTLRRRVSRARTGLEPKSGKTRSANRRSGP